MLVLEVLVLVLALAVVVVVGWWWWSGGDGSHTPGCPPDLGRRRGERQAARRGERRAAPSPPLTLLTLVV